MKLIKKATFFFILSFLAIWNSDTFSDEVHKLIGQKDPAHYSGLLQDPLFFAADCTFTIKGSQNMGTGFFISSEGYAVTCKHVVEDDEDHVAILHNRKEFAIGVIATSDRYDLALILVTTPQKTPYLSFRDPYSLSSGDKIYAIGSSHELKPTLTGGAFNGLREKIPGNSLVIQFSAPLNPGYSGGPLIDAKGKVIGVVSWKLVADKVLPVKGVGFAVPVEYMVEEYASYME